MAESSDTSLVARAKLGYCAPGGLVDEVESFLQSMMETIAAAIASLRVRLVASAPPAIVRLEIIFLPRPNGRGFSSAKPFHHDEIQHTTALLLLSPGCCATSHHPAKATFAAFRLPTRLRFTLRRSWTLPAKASLKAQAHSPSH